MTEEQLQLLQEAQRSISAADLLLSNGFPGYAAARAYFAMFYIAEAFLEGEGLSFSKHSAVIAAFGQHIAHTGKAPVEFHRFLLRAFDLRQRGDYGHPDPVTLEEAQEQVAHARQFLQLAERLIGPVSSAGANQQ